MTVGCIIILRSVFSQNCIQCLYYWPLFFKDRWFLKSVFVFEWFCSQLFYVPSLYWNFYGVLKYKSHISSHGLLFTGPSGTLEGLPLGHYHRDKDVCVWRASRPLWSLPLQQRDLLQQDQSVWYTDQLLAEHASNTAVARGTQESFSL